MHLIHQIVMIFCRKIFVILRAFLLLLIIFQNIRFLVNICPTNVVLIISIYMNFGKHWGLFTIYPGLVHIYNRNNTLICHSKQTNPALSKTFPIYLLKSFAHWCDYSSFTINFCFPLARTYHQFLQEAANVGGDTSDAVTGWWLWLLLGKLLLGLPKA